MFIANDRSPQTLRSVRSEMCLLPARAPSCCAPKERESNSMTSAYKHLAPLGRIQSINSLDFQVECASTRAIH
jgi:hypothetical protein